MPVKNLQAAPYPSCRLITHLGHLPVIGLTSRQGFDVINRFIFRGQHDREPRMNQRSTSDYCRIKG